MNNSFAALAAENSQRKPRPKPKKNIEIPKSVLHQMQLRKKHNYIYGLVSNGNIENNSTLYVGTELAHPHQVEKLFTEVIAKAKAMPEIFGANFECDVQINLVRKYTGQYMGYAFVDVDNPKLYYALIGYNVNGTDRVNYVPDPNWIPPTIKSAATSTSSDWADDGEDIVPSHPNIRKELSALLTLGEYTYDDQQKAHMKQHLQLEELKGSVTVSPAFITPGVDDEYDDSTLYVSEVPDMDYDFLYTIFSRYARYNSHDEDTNRFYPRITIRKNNDKLFGIVQYANPYDAKFAVSMLQKIRANYNGRDIIMPVRHAFKNKRQ